MRNFNTNQTRHFYVAGAIDSSVDSNLDIALVAAATGELFFKYRNADGLLTRSDTFDPKKIISLKKTTSAEMAIPLLAHKIAVDSSAVTLSALVGKAIDLTITLHDVYDYDSESTIVASIVGNSTNTGSASNFYNAMAVAIFDALPKADKNFPPYSVYVVKSSTATKVTADNRGNINVSSATGIVIAEELQKHVTGKLTGEPVHLSLAFRAHKDDEVWGTDTVSTVAALNSSLSVSIAPTVYPTNYVLADLEYFALGERGDVYRGFNFPNDYTPTYAINPATTYNVLSVEYYWAGDAENVQKSPRLIQVAAPATVSDDIVTTLYSTILAAMGGSGSGSGA